VGANQRNIIGLALKLEPMGAFGSAPDRNAGSLQQVQE
jgi:hypothetical protein